MSNLGALMRESIETLRESRAALMAHFGAMNAAAVAATRAESEARSGLTTPARRELHVRRAASVPSPGAAESYNARARALGLGQVSWGEWLDILDYYGWRCGYCTAPASGMDHLEPICAGGAHAAHNLVPACWPCNLLKGKRSLLFWALRGGAV